MDINKHQTSWSLWIKSYSSPRKNSQKLRQTYQNLR